jgi:putative membrane protein
MTMSQEEAPTRNEPSRPRATASTTLVHALQGVLMGSADVIPGVSGGTVALILGIYERLVGTIHDVAASIFALVRGNRGRAREYWRRADFALVLPLLAGIAVALAIGSVVLPPLIETYPVIMSALFFGLIAGALPIPWRRISALRGKHFALAIAGALVAFALTGFAPRTIEDPALLLVFGVAAIAICAMILPGISGAYLLLVMGMYEVTLHAVRDLDVLYVAVFMAGAATGLGLFSKLLAWLLDHRHDATMAVLVGLMAGSLRKLWPWQADTGALRAPAGGGEVLLALACVAAGIVIVVALTRLGEHSLSERRETVARH